MVPMVTHPLVSVFLLSLSYVLVHCGTHTRITLGARPHVALTAMFRAVLYGTALLFVLGALSTSSLVEVGF